MYIILKWHEILGNLKEHKSLTRQFQGTTMTVYALKSILYLWPQPQRANTTRCSFVGVPEADVSVTLGYRYCYSVQM